MTDPTKKQLAARHTRRLRTMRQHLLAMSEQWQDHDQYNATQLEELADDAELVAIGLYEIESKDEEKGHD